MKAHILFLFCLLTVNLGGRIEAGTYKELGNLQKEFGPTRGGNAPYQNRRPRHNTRHFPSAEFKSIAKHTPVYPYPIPYRCLYSRNVDNLFMVGRNISVTHVALGTVRVMRTTGMMGEVVGMAASLCKQHTVKPRDIYQRYLNELKALMTEGVGRKGLPNNQQYNEGGTLTTKPEIK